MFTSVVCVMASSAHMFTSVVCVMASSPHSVRGPQVSVVHTLPFHTQFNVNT